MCGKDQPDIVFPDQPSPMDEALANIRLERERAMIAEQNRAAEERRQSAERSRLTQEFNQNLDNAYSGSLNTARQRLTEMGLDPNELMGTIEGELQNIRRAVPIRDQNPASYFGPNTVDNALNRIRDNRRNSYTNEVSKITPYGYEKDYIPDTLDDPFLDEIYNEQYSDANDQLQRATARGNLSPLGSTVAQRKLQQQGVAGRSRLQSLGESVLSNYRNELRGIGDTASRDAGGYELGRTFDPSKYRNMLEAKRGEFGSRVAGDIRNVAGNENLFNVDEVIAKGGISQGLYNPATATSSVGGSPIFNALANRRKTRGLETGASSNASVPQSGAY